LTPFFTIGLFLRLILTGTPHGVGMAAKPTPRWLRPGDSVSIEIEKIGTLTNPVALEA
jgi:2-keto-4-pentenoate hydratase/2-oxohepta-3-ene-1,7-dioic acid hydratase in catechol pathway